MQTITLKRSLILNLTLGVTERLKKAGLLDVFALPSEPEQFSELIADPQRLAAVMWEMCDRTAITLEQFLEWFATSEPDKLRESVFAEIVAFFREAMRPVVAALIASAKSADASVCETMLTMIRQTPPNVVSVKETKFGKEFGSLVASSESIREHLPGSNSMTWPLGVNEQNGVDQAA